MCSVIGTVNNKPRNTSTLKAITGRDRQQTNELKEANSQRKMWDKNYFGEKTGREKEKSLSLSLCTTNLLTCEVDRVLYRVVVNREIDRQHASNGNRADTAILCLGLQPIMYSYSSRLSRSTAQVERD